MTVNLCLVEDLFSNLYNFVYRNQNPAEAEVVAHFSRAKYDFLPNIRYASFLSPNFSV